jgi:hypothetical protein
MLGKWSWEFEKFGDFSKEARQKIKKEPQFFVRDR